MAVQDLALSWPRLVRRGRNFRLPRSLPSSPLHNRRTPVLLGLLVNSSAGPITLSFLPCPAEEAKKKKKKKEGTTTLVLFYLTRSIGAVSSGRTDRYPVDFFFLHFHTCCEGEACDESYPEQEVASFFPPPFSIDERELALSYIRTRNRAPRSTISFCATYTPKPFPLSAHPLESRSLHQQFSYKIRPLV